MISTELKPKSWSDGVSLPGYNKFPSSSAQLPTDTTTCTLGAETLQPNTNSSSPRWIYQPSHLEGGGPVEFGSVDGFWKYISDVGYELLQELAGFLQVGGVIIICTSCKGKEDIQPSCS